jgi:hypothetical protein
MIRMDKNVIGSWKLIKFEMKTNDNISYPYGENPLGYLIYSENGFMAVLISKDNRNNISAENITKISEEEKIQLADGFIGYIGKYEVLNNKIVHHVKLSFIPNWMGMPLERFCEFYKGNLILETPSEEIDGSIYASRLIWKKL